MGFSYTDNYPTTRIPLFVHPFVGSSLANVLYAQLPMYFGPFTQCNHNVKLKVQSYQGRWPQIKKFKKKQLVLKINLNKA